MAIHTSKFSMQKEALKEMLEVAEYCLHFDKLKSKSWAGYKGCYGYPCASLLLSIVDCIGSHVEEGGGHLTKINFKVLNNKDYYNLNLSKDEVEVLRDKFRNKLSHNARISSDNYQLVPAYPGGKVLNFHEGIYILNLEAFFQISSRMVQKILNE